jgi:hypothetical protein
MMLFNQALARWLEEIGANDRSVMWCDRCDARILCWDIAAQMRDNRGAVCRPCAERQSTLRAAVEATAGGEG